MQTSPPYPLSQKLRDFSSPHALIASGFFSGLSPFASGTTGSAAALLVWYALSRGGIIDTILSQILVAFLVTAIGLYSTSRFLRSPLNSRIRSRKEGDPGVVVIDEWSGMMITLIGGANNSLWYLALGFLLFRLFDVLKPGPVDTLQKLPGTWGVMLDDVGAGLLALACMQIIKWFWF
jgi:phosphatidylglycerophosphatase A